MGSSGLSKAAFDQMVLLHLPACQRFAVRLTGDVHAAEEVLQDAMLRATKSRESFRGDAKFQTWIFRITLNAWHDHLRARGRHRDVDTPGADVAYEPDPTDQLAAQELGQLVAHAVSSLPPRQREVLVMTAYEHISIGDVAETLGTTESNVRTNLSLARSRLRHLLRNHLPQEAQRHEP
jgi:RNA polymerase sigma-70 factor (ECF subfamily)